jgi:hypothetical protein
LETVLKVNVKKQKVSKFTPNLSSLNRTQQNDHDEKGVSKEAIVKDKINTHRSHLAFGNELENVQENMLCGKQLIFKKIQRLAHSYKEEPKSPSSRLTKRNQKRYW